MPVFYFLPAIETNLLRVMHTHTHTLMFTEPLDYIFLMVLGCITQRASVKEQTARHAYLHIANHLTPFILSSTDTTPTYLPNLHTQTFVQYLPI